MTRRPVLHVAKPDDPHCPWCGECFDSWALAKPHVKHCYNAPHKRKPHEVRTTAKKCAPVRQGKLF